MYISVVAPPHNDDVRQNYVSNMCPVFSYLLNDQYLMNTDLSSQYTDIYNIAKGTLIIFASCYVIIIMIRKLKQEHASVYVLI